MYAVAGIEFNHESPRRSTEFLSRKVSLGVARIKLGHRKQLGLGRLSGARDWGFAGDFVRGMHMILSQKEPDDYVLGTGVSHTVEELVALAFRAVDLNWRDYVVCETSSIRSIEPENLCADPTKARSELDWQPTIRFDDLIPMMVEADLALISTEDHRVV
jgi:GDPmannose 4,6-dehydratase